MYKIIAKDDGIVHKQEDGADLFCFRKFYFIFDENKQELMDPEKYRYETQEEAEETAALFNQFSIVKVC